MPDINVPETKKKIIDILKIRGPILPVQLAREIGSNSIFSGALLSELYGEKELKISNMKVGGSPLYFLKGQEEVLEKFHTYLPGKEKEAFLLLKENRILKDSAQFPAIRVALRSLKDFAFHFSQDNEIFWKFHTTTGDEIKDRLTLLGKQETKTEKEPQETKVAEPEKIQDIKQESEIKKEKEALPQEIKEIAKKEEKLEEEKELGIIEMPKPKISAKDKFLEEVKNFLSFKAIQLTSIEKYDKKEVNALININDSEYFLVALNKKKIDESDIVKAYKKASKFNLPFHLFAKGELSKKARESLEALKRLSSIEILK